MPYTIAIIGLGKIAEDQHLPGHRQEQGFQARGHCQPARTEPARRPDLPHHRPSSWPRCPRSMPSRSAPRPGRAMRSPGKRWRPASMSCSKSPRPPTLVGTRRISPWTRQQRKRVLFTTWHSQFNPAVDEAKKRLAGALDPLAPHRMEGGCAPLASGPGMDLGAGRLRRLRSGHQCLVDRDQDHALADLHRQCRSLCAEELRDADCGIADLPLGRLSPAASSPPNSTGARKASRPGRSPSRPPTARCSRWRKAARGS